MDTWLQPIPTTPAWTEHLRSRLDAAREIGLLARASEGAAYKADILLPSGHRASGVDDPSMPLRALVGPVPRPGWQAREDLFDEAVAYVRRLVGPRGHRYLLCEAGYAQVGDKYLESRQYFELEGKPILFADIGKTEDKNLTEILRLGRSFRLIGAIARNLIMSNKGNFQTEALIFDALDCDSLIFVQQNLIQ